MENFTKYLNFVNESLKNIQKFDNIHLVLGNESCDIDSSVSSIILAYYLHISKTCPIPKNALIIPVQNVHSENFIYRSDNCFLYKEVNIPLELLVYRNQLNLEELIRTKNVTTTLVDHHILSDNNKILESTVIQIFDHRPRDELFPWDENKIQIIMQEVGSCSTIIADRLFLVDECQLFEELGYLIYATIIYDTQALSSKSGRAKELDHQVINALEEKFHFPDNRQILFDKLWKAHNDVSHLTPKQILFKDLKLVDYVPVPGLPMLVEDFLKLEGSYEGVKDFADEYKTSIVVLIGLDASNGVKRDIAVFSKTEALEIKNKIVEMLTNSQKYKGYDFDLKEVATSFEDITCFRQDNVKWSRKQIIPIIKDIVNASK